MKIQLNLDSLAVLLFCGDLVVDNTAALSQDEWYNVERKLKSSTKKTPSKLFGMNKDTLIDILGIEEYIAYKMIARLSTINELLFALSNLENEGISITTKYEDNFPNLLTKHLRKRAPLYLFYCGDISIIKNGISLMGLVKVTKKDRIHTKRLIDKVVDEDYVYISNDSKGIDTVALKYALQHGCNCVSFVCERLAAKQKEYSRYIKNGQLVMLCAEDPNSYFDVTNAIDRNSYVCALSKYQIIISSSINNGATWFTALQNLHNKWTIPMAIEVVYLGNDRLLDMGVTPVYVNDVLSDYTFDMIYEKNKKVIENNEINIDQMSIFEFIGE